MDVIPEMADDSESDLRDAKEPNCRCFEPAAPYSPAAEPQKFASDLKELLKAQMPRLRKKV